MKKEWIAVALLTCVILGSFLNLRYLKSITNDFDKQICTAVLEADADNWASAESAASRAMMDWVRMDNYTHVFIRHGEIDALTDAFCALLGAIRSQDKASLFAAQLSLRSRLAELYEMERVTPGSIL